MRKPLVVVGMVLVLGAAALWLVTCRRDGRKPTTTAGARAGAGATTATSPRAPRDARPDPRTLALASIRGTVTVKGGGPLAAAQVCAQGWVVGVPPDETRDPRCVVTDAAGRYVIDGLYVGTYGVTASAARHVPARWRGPLPTRADDFELAAGERRDGVDLALAPGGVEVHGTVGDIGGGPIADAWVSVASGQRWSGSAAAITRSDLDGGFTVWVAAGAIYASASADGYADGRAESTAPTRRLEVLLTPESVLAGTVVDAETGKPVPDATVEVQSDWREGGEYGWALTDAQGTWRITRLGPGRYKPRAEVLGRMGEPADSVLLGLGETVDGIVIPVHAVRVVTGRVVIADGSGADHDADGGVGAPGCPKGWIWGTGKTGRNISARIEAGGEVRFEAVAPGRYELQVHCEGHVAEGSYPPVEVGDQDVTGLLWQVHGGGTLVGTLKTTAGAPIVGAEVSARSVGGDPRGARGWGSERTEDDGSFRMSGMAPGEVLIEVSSAGYPAPAEPPRATVVAGQETRIDLVLADGGAIAGVVVGEDGAPVPGAQVNAHGARWSFGYDPQRTADDGTFAIKGLDAGSYRVVASRGWTDTMRKPGSTDDDLVGERVQVEIGATAQVRLVVESQRGVIAGVVVDAQGAPVSDAYLVTERESDVDGEPSGAAMRQSRWTWDRKPVVTDPAGAFEIGDLVATGTYTVRAYRRGGGEAFAEHVKAGTRTARLVVRATGSLGGKVTRRGGTAPDDFTVALIDGITGFERTERFFRTGGAFTIAELPAGSFKLTVSATDGRAESTVTLTEGERRTDLAFELAARVVVRGRIVALDDGAPVPGIQVIVNAQGNDSFSFGGEASTNHISDLDGRFTVEDAPSGPVNVTGFPTDYGATTFAYLRVPRTLVAGDNDLGELKIPRSRVGPRDRGGEFGFELKQYGPEVLEADRQFEIRKVRAGSAAAKGGIVRGDVIVAVDGVDVTGDNRYLASSLWRVPVGTKVSFGLARGATVELVAAAPE